MDDNKVRNELMADYKNSPDSKRKHITVFYKGVEITDKIGLCVCDDCTEHIRKVIDNGSVDKELKCL